MASINTTVFCSILNCFDLFFLCHFLSCDHQVQVKSVIMSSQNLDARLQKASNINRLDVLKKLLEKDANRKRQAYTTEVKYHAFMVLESGMKQTQLAKQLGVHKGTLSKWVRDKQRILEAVHAGKALNRNKDKDSKWSELSDAMQQWVCGITSHDTDARIDGPQFKAQADKQAQSLFLKGFKQYENFKCSEGFFSWWKTRLQFSHKRATGEKNSAQPGAVEAFLETTMKDILGR